MVCQGLTLGQRTPPSGQTVTVKAVERVCSSLLLLLLLNKSNDGFVVCLQAKRAVQRGATAVIFDVSENPDAIDQVCAHLKASQAFTRSRFNSSQTL